MFKNVSTTNYAKHISDCPCELKLTPVLRLGVIATVVARLTASMEGEAAPLTFPPNIG